MQFVRIISSVSAASLFREEQTRANSASDTRHLCAHPTPGESASSRHAPAPTAREQFPQAPSGPAHRSRQMGDSRSPARVASVPADGGEKGSLEKPKRRTPLTRLQLPAVLSLRTALSLLSQTPPSD